MSLPNIEHATVTRNTAGGTVIRMDPGYVFYDVDTYADLTDDEGNPREPYPDELCYFRYIVFAPSVSSDEIERRIVVVAESDVPSNQIFGVGDDNHEII